MYALFAAIPFVGHINPLVRQAETLQRRGWRTAIAVHRELGAHVARESAGMPMVDLGALGPLRTRLQALEAAASADPSYTRGALRLAPLLLETWPSMYDALRLAITIDRPNVLVADLFTSAGWSAALDAGVPLVINNPALLNAIPSPPLPPAPDVPFLASGKSIHAMGRLDRWLEPLARHGATLLMRLTLGRHIDVCRRQRGLPPIDQERVMRNAPILVDAVFGVEYQRRLPSNAHMIGPMLAPLKPIEPNLARWLDEGAPVVYASLGTVARASVPQLAKMAEAFSRGAHRVLWVVRDASRDHLPRTLPPHVRVVGWVDSPRAVLAHPNVRAFVSHCGMNSVYESLAAGTPIVGIPMLSDQRDMAVRVADAGLGLWCDKTRFTVDALRSAIARVAADEGFRLRAAAIRQTIHAAGGAARAAELIASTATASPASVV